MSGFLAFLFVYILGGLTFLPLIIYFVFTSAADAGSDSAVEESIVQTGDDVDTIGQVQRTLKEKYQSRDGHEPEVFAGWFAVSREYTERGLNGKPPERITPIGSTTVSAPSPSVYQSMYRSIFERKPANSPLENKNNTKPLKRGNNVFYVVLRHGHLMLFDDDEQLEVRHVVSLAHHEVSIYAGGDEIPEGELFIKRNSLRLARRMDMGGLTPDAQVSKPFYFFSENCSEKEDFYFTLLRNQERKPDAQYNPPTPLLYNIKDIITLVQKLHSSEEQLQTRWLNAVIGRVFLALYKTSEVEDFIRSKITKKISRVKTPSFLSKIALKTIDMGQAAPVFTNPRLKDLTVDGEMVIEADMRYSGNFRLEVATTARIDLGSRFKAREVNLLLAVLVKRIEGHVMLRIKPPPSNRLWFTFSSMPKIDMTIEPIISARQITYTLILRQIENRIKEVMAETLVMPNWDDIPFYNTEHKTWRGGTWTDDTPSDRPLSPVMARAQHGEVDELEQLEPDVTDSMIAIPQAAPHTDATQQPGMYKRKDSSSTTSVVDTNPGASSTSVDTSSLILDKPRALKAGNFASASSPIISTDVTTADAHRTTMPTEHQQAKAAISALSQSAPPVGSPVLPSRLDKPGSISSRESTSSEIDKTSGNVEEVTPQASLKHTRTPSLASDPSGSITDASLIPDSPSKASIGSNGRGSRRDDSSASSTKSTASENKRISLAAVTSAAATAKKWGWNALQRHGEQKNEVNAEATSSRPLVMGRGQPLPPPGVPLPKPSKAISVPKRKPMPPPSSNINDLGHDQKINPMPQESKAPMPEKQPPPLPRRRNPDDSSVPGGTADDGLLVVEAPPADSEPTTPMTEETPNYLPPWVDDDQEEPGTIDPPPSNIHPNQQSPLRLPKRRPLHRVMSTSPEEDGHKLPSWMAAQEEEARARTGFMDEDGGV